MSTPSGTQKDSPAAPSLYLRSGTLELLDRSPPTLHSTDNKLTTRRTNWHNLAEANAACANGTQQSPIDLTESSARSLPAGSLNITIPNVEKAEFENLGSTIEVVMEGVGGKTTIADKE